MYKFSLVLLAICLQASDIHISEVMSNPQGSEYENEFIEIFNSSEHPHILDGWILSDGSGLDSIIIWFGPEPIRAQSYAVILDPGYDVDADLYQLMSQDSIPIYTISTDASFGSGGLANAGEEVIIRSPDSTSTSHMTWTSSTDNGFSWERVLFDQPDSLAIWAQSLHENGTPGILNSVSPPRINLSLSEATITYAEVGERIEVCLSIQNSGQELISNFSIGAVRDDNQNGVFDAGEWSHSQEHTDPLQSEEEVDINLQLFDMEPGIHKLIFSVLVEGSESRSDDSLWTEIAGGYPSESLSITEIMYSPNSEQGGEWIEIKNISDSPVSMQAWTFTDGNQTRHIITDSLIYLEPESLITLAASPEMSEYFELAKEKIMLPLTWPTLNASSDSVRLYDGRGILNTRVYYRGSWGSSGRSLERRQPYLLPFDEWNWLASSHADGGTPSRVNTQQLAPYNVLIESITTVLANPIGPSRALVSVEFSNQGLETLYSLHFEWGDSENWIGLLQSYESEIFDFMTPELPPGSSQINLQIYHNAILLADTSLELILGFPPGQIALNEIHYLPNEDQVEFMELINVGPSELDISGWRIQDRSGTNGVVNEQILIPRDSLFVLCKDQANLAYWSPPHTPIFEVTPWPNLNNTSDSIFIFDSQGNLQLNHSYDLNHGGETGRSMERLSLWKLPELGDSWSTCVDSTGITPGRKNSILLPPNNLVLSKMSVSDSILMAGEIFSIELEIINAGRAATPPGSVTLQILHDDVLYHQTDETFEIIEKGDTLNLSVDIETEKCGWMDILVQIQSVDDLLEDNHLSLRTYISCVSSPLIINEVMALPATNEGEWIEIYNRSIWDVDIQGWQFSDNSLAGKLISDTSLFIKGNGYLVLSATPEQELGEMSYLSQYVYGFPILNNTEDALVLFDPHGTRVDEMTYTSITAMAEEHSLERIRVDAPGSNMSNWGVCIDENTSTPGHQNSLFLDELNPKVNIQLLPNPFTPDGDGFKDELSIEFDLPMDQGLMTIMIFDMAGRKIAEPYIARPVSHRGMLSWQGQANYGGPAATGLYIMKIVVDDLSGQVYEVFKKVYLVR